MRAKGLSHSGEIFSNISLEFGHRDDIRFLEARAASQTTDNIAWGHSAPLSPEALPLACCA